MRIFMKKEISTKNAPSAIGPYSQAIEVNGMIFTSGMIPINPQTGELVTGSVEAQAEQAFTNLKALIEDAGSSMDKVVKTVVFIKDMEDFSKINAIYEKYFTEPYPARSCVEVARLPKDVALEVEAVTIK
jgi:2-iminobutanoate/2-iminopropanoate deaminase